MSSTPVDLEAIRARLAKATPGPWTADKMGYYVWSPKMEMVADADEHFDPNGTVARARGYGAGLPQLANLDLIAHAPTDLAALLTLCEQQRQEIEALREDVALVRSCERQVEASALEIEAENARLTRERDDARRERDTLSDPVGTVLRTFCLMPRYKTGGYGAMIEDEGGKWVEAKAVEDLLDGSRPEYLAADKAEQRP